MNSMTIDIVLLGGFFFGDHVEVLRNNCHKRWRLIKLRNLFLEFKISFIFHVMSSFFLINLNINTYLTRTCTKIVIFF